MRTPADCLSLARDTRCGAALGELARCPYPFVWRAVAANPHAPPAVLVALTTARSSAWADNGLLRLLAAHPNADRRVLRAVLRATAAGLTEGERPYAAVLVLAEREELAVAEVAPLGALRGASARLRRGLTRRLAARGAAAERG
ncbi:hypothetical protein RM844_06130 [Streptomyces sp. DSM 44915]|uniref:Uncharacterized protein n=1 Tax=Streptomyces chisholmiae TaxID=3075540 RepID=A0ABU2JM84_9ACTN|nr:hypothetical protein [Streptomyces sp. DSM 44915]MDT0265866.1 hypothetical protein [Streptomyces sp. DSM 44915]